MDRTGHLGRLFSRASRTGVSPELQPLDDEGAPAASAGDLGGDEAAEDGHQSSEEIGEEQRQVIVKRSPADPTDREIQEHRAAGHVVHRSWCLHCQRARVTGQRHRSGDPARDEDGRMPYVSLDYFYLNSGQEKSDADGILPCLVVKCHKTGRYWANVVPSKGAELFAVEWLKSCLNETGFKELCLKSDNEPAIMALKNKVKEESRLKIHLAEAPVEDHQANGFIEVAVREVKRQVRAMLSDLQERLGFEVEPSHPCMMWLPRHAAYLLTRFRIGPDGKTPYERTFGRSWRIPLVSFGEHILFRPRPPRDGRRHDLAPRVSMGMFVGTGLRNNDIFVMTARGIVKGNTITRRPPEDQFKYENWSELRGVPWRLQSREAGEVRVDLPLVVGPLSRPPAEEVIPRNLYVTKSDIEKYGRTPLCPGCEAQLLETGRRAHNAECRFRIEGELMKSEEGKKRIEAAKARIESGRRPKAPRVGGGADESEVVEAANVPALVGIPEPDAEMASGEAVGEPLERVAPRELEEREEEPRSPKKHKSGTSRTKRSPEADVEELHQQMQEEVPAEGAAESGPIPAAGSNDPRPHMPPVAPPDASPGGDDMVDIGHLSMCLCSVLRAARKKGNVQKTVSEIFSPPRVSAQAQLVGLRPGFAIDLETKREDGDHWDLSKDSHIEDLFTLLDKEKPKLLGGSPPCGPFSQLQNLVDARNQVPASVRSKRLQEGKKHLRTSVRAYRAQMDAGRYFLHEHPKGARSWEEPEVEELRKDPRVYEVTGPMCRWKMESSDAWGKGLVKKETRWLTNSRHIAAILSGVCSNVEGKTWHRHVNLINGRARSAQVYPPLLVRGILEALRNQLAEDGEFSQALNSLGAGPVPDAVPVIDEEQEVYDSLPPADLPVAGPVYDSNTGAELDLAKVAAARREELDWVQKQCIYKKVPAEQARAAGKVPITMKWVDRNKGDLDRPNYRSRIVCREIKRSKNADYIPEHASFSAMPPLEALKMLLSLMVTLRTSKRNRKPLKLRLLDISRAHFYGHAQREIFVTLPEGDQEEGMVGLLLKSMYGTRDAAHIWQQSYTDVLLAAGFKRSAAWPAIFFHERLEARLLVHGDDFVILGDDAAQEFVEKALREKYDLRVDGSIGVGEAKQEFCVLNRLVRFDERSGSIFYEPDPRHAEILLKDLGMETCKPVKSPNEKLTAEALAKRLELDVVDPHRISQYRSLTMRAAFLAQDRPDLSETVKCLARKMQGPTEADFGDLKRLARYLKGNMRMVQKFTPQKFSNVVSVHADSDFAGCLLTRKSTTGLVCYYGRHTLRHSSNLQSTVSLSSGESEYYALVKAVASGMATQELLRSWGINVNLQVYTDSAAALGTCNRLGLGKSRHIQTRYLWIQEKLAERSFELIKIDTKLNTADICTKALASEAAERHLKAMGFEVVQGRSSIAKAVV